MFCYKDLAIETYVPSRPQFHGSFHIVNFAFPGDVNILGLDVAVYVDAEDFDLFYPF